MNSRNQSAVHFEEGSGNVFADLGLVDSAELYTRAHWCSCAENSQGQRNGRAPDSGCPGNYSAGRVALDEGALR